MIEIQTKYYLFKLDCPAQNCGAMTVFQKPVIEVWVDYNKKTLFFDSFKEQQNAKILISKEAEKSHKELSLRFNAAIEEMRG